MPNVPHVYRMLETSDRFRNPAIFFFKWVINIHICRAVPNVPHGCRIQEQSPSKPGETFSTRKWLKTCLTKTLLHLIIKSDHVFVKEVDQT